MQWSWSTSMESWTRSSPLNAGPPFSRRRLLPPSAPAAPVYAHRLRRTLRQPLRMPTPRFGDGDILIVILNDGAASSSSLPWQRLRAWLPQARLDRVTALSSSLQRRPWRQRPLDPTVANADGLLFSPVAPNQIDGCFLVLNLGSGSGDDSRPDPTAALTPRSDGSQFVILLVPVKKKAH